MEISQSRPSSKRLRNEFNPSKFASNYLKYKSGIKMVGLNIDDNEMNVNKDIEVTLTLMYDKKYYYLKIICGNDYPFKPPKLVRINNVKYDGNFPTNNRINKFLSDKYKIMCLCCNSLMCYDNWSPRFILMDIIKEKIEWEEILELYKKYCLVVDKQLFPEDIDNYLLDFLF